jgi:CrcB protein
MLAEVRLGVARSQDFAMLMVPNPVDGFSLDILVANLVAAFLLGLAAALHSRQVVSDGVNIPYGWTVDV